jgi:hypothetical protein
MRLNVINVLNVIASEEASVKNNMRETQPFGGRTDLDWYEEYLLERWKKAQEEKRIAIAPWAHVTDIEDYYECWLHEKGMAEYWNDLAAKECDRRMWEGKDYSDIHFDETPTFDEWMKREMEIISKYMVVAA